MNPRSALFIGAPCIRRSWIAALPLLAAILGCVPPNSLRPFYLPGQVLVEPAFVGEWAERPGDSEWRVRQEGDDAYVIDMPITESSYLHAVCHLFELGGARFLDAATAAVPDSEAGRLLPFPSIAGHTLLRLEVRGDTLVWSDLDEEWWASRLKENPKVLRHEVVGPDDTYDEEVIILTATTEELQEFIKKEMRLNPKAWREMFREENIFIRKKAAR